MVNNDANGSVYKLEDFGVARMLKRNERSVALHGTWKIGREDVKTMFEMVSEKMDILKPSTLRMESCGQINDQLFMCMRN